MAPLPDPVAADLAAALHEHEAALLSALADNPAVRDVLWQLLVFPTQVTS